MRPKRNSGVGLALIISLAMDQIFCFAPSIRPDIEPVVSRTKQTSMRGLADLGWGFSDLSSASAVTANRAATPARRIRAVVFIGSQSCFSHERWTACAAKASRKICSALLSVKTDADGSAPGTFLLPIGWRQGENSPRGFAH